MTLTEQFNGKHYTFEKLTATKIMVREVAMREGGKAYEMDFRANTAIMYQSESKAVFPGSPVTHYAYDEGTRVSLLDLDKYLVKLAEEKLAELGREKIVPATFAKPSEIKNTTVGC